MLRDRMATSSSLASGVRTVGKVLAEGDSAGKSAHGSEAIMHDGGGGGREDLLFAGEAVFRIVCARSRRLAVHRKQKCAPETDKRSVTAWGKSFYRLGCRLTVRRHGHESSLASGDGCCWPTRRRSRSLDRRGTDSFQSTSLLIELGVRRSLAGIVSRQAAEVLVLLGHSEWPAKHARPLKERKQVVNSIRSSSCIARDDGHRE